ncbi:UDP:flavonoid glycosyltransferase YjiC, YdhE family [Actinoplanes derwentensis]|uniref:UDP:flavonoid glycosyltransferase YjiC, YdhE family n=2 Tax=Actinoplanes derwentensis TaxID=113562 RepID=A0A1H1W9E4_9ACTN|nr:UDP:flavonoid glycosyltransferase YjiC, YdhE family [Actinoplanes derwentensis]
MVTWGWRTHFLPLAPLGWALRAAGHDVRVACQPGQVAAVTEAGLPAVPVGPPLGFADVFRGQVGKVASREAFDTGTDLDGLAPQVTEDGGTLRFADVMVDDLITYGRHYRPDLVLYEPFNIAGAIAAAALGVPDVRLLWGPDSTTELHLDEDKLIGPRARRAGASGVRITGTLTLDPCPAALQVPVTGPTHPIRFVPYNGAAILPDWLRHPPDRPRICLTWGTMMAELGLTDRISVTTIADALSELDAEIVLALAPRHRDTLGPLPANVRVPTEHLALHLLLPGCAAVVHQGGAGTLMTAMACGVPQMVVPAVTDQHFNGERLTRAGAGTVLADGDEHPAAIRAALQRLLTDPGPAAALAVENAARPTPAAVVPVLEDLAATGRRDFIPGGTP